MPHKIILIDGGTGTAKTRMLALLKEAGAQVIDLEALAGHRGSLFGGLSHAQPAQKMFETRLSHALRQLDPSQPVYLEAEGNKIGNILIPPSLWKAMIAAPHIQLSAPLSARADFLLHAYDDLVADPRILSGRLGKLQPFHGAEQVAAWQGLATAGDYRQLAMELIERHYDPRYEKAAVKRVQCLAEIQMSDLSETSLAQACDDILTKIKAGKALAAPA